MEFHSDFFIKAADFVGALLPHQQRAIDKLKKTDAILLYHGLGSGKTATSIAMTEGDNAEVVVPASLRGNYEKEIKKFTKGAPSRSVVSYNKFLKEPYSTSKTLVLDEPQKIGRTSSHTSQAIVNHAKNFNKRILLSGTPASNNPAELAPIIRTLTPGAVNIPLNPTDFNKKFIGETKVQAPILQRIFLGAQPGVENYVKNIDDIKSAIKGKVDYYQPSQEHYPERINETRDVEASKEQMKYYSVVTHKANPVLAWKVKRNMPLSKQESTQLNAFMTAARQVSNTTKPYGGKEELTPKINAVVSDFESQMKNNPHHKGIIYSNYLSSGINEVANQFDKKQIPYVKFTGDLGETKRKQAISDYNEGRTKAILLSGAGAEGLDLKGTRSIQIMEPHWNKNKIEQVIGRGIRYKSHDALPENERNVHVIQYHTTVPKTMTQKILRKKSDTSTDQYLDELGAKKQHLLDKFLDVLKEEGSS